MGIKQELDEYGYPKNRHWDFNNPPGNRATCVALVIAFTLIIIGIIYGTRI